MKKQFTYEEYLQLKKHGYAGKENGKYWVMYWTDKGTTLDKDIQLLTKGE